MLNDSFQLSKALCELRHPDKTIMKSFSLVAGTWVLIPAILMILTSPIMAVDPLPLELENAPLKAQAAWRERMGRESQQEKEQVAQQRFNQRMAFKQGLMAQVHREAADRRDAVLSPVPEPLPVVESGIVTPRERNFILLFASLAGLAYLARRYFQSDQPARAQR